jgi:surface carbohydrate biosynthesis protein (TIGR04326 family)
MSKRQAKSNNHNLQSLLLIFDQDVNVKKLASIVKSNTVNSIKLFPLTSMWNISQRIREEFEVNDGVKVECVNSALLFDKQVDRIRAKIAKWSHELGNYQIAGRSIKKWFLLPDGRASTWWFSLLAEKNTLKTSAFFRMAQIQAVDKIISENSFDLCLLSIGHRDFNQAVGKLLARHGLNVQLVRPMNLDKFSFRSMKALIFPINSLLFKGLKAFAYLNLQLFRAVKARVIMPSFRKRIKKIDNDLLFISYFPSVDKIAAQKGTLKNKYAIPLQEKLSELGKKITWLWMYVPLDGNSYGDALAYGKKFAKNDHINFFLEEFICLKVYLKTLWYWLRQVRLFLKLKKSIPDTILTDNLTAPECALFVNRLMQKSFIGYAGIQGILFLQVYKRLFSKLTEPHICLYYSEMHAWENALNIASGQCSVSVRTIGFQHTSISKNYFHYLKSSKEFQGLDTCPGPDILACNGDYTRDWLRSNGFNNTTKVEAIRHLYLYDLLKIEPERFEKENVVLIAGSIDKRETMALIAMFHQAFPSKSNNFQIWLKAHPSLSFEQILKDMELNAEQTGYVIKNEPISELVRKSKITVAGSSTVSIEALAAGNIVILPIFPDKMFMNPLKGFEEFYTNPCTPEQLRNTIVQNLASENILDYGKIKTFISHYWCLDTTLSRWNDLLK